MDNRKTNDLNRESVPKVGPSYFVTALVVKKYNF